MEYKEPSLPPIEEPHPATPQSPIIKDDFDYMCSFGVDASGNEVEGIITQLEHDLLCNSVEKKDFCDECTKNIVVVEDPVVTELSVLTLSIVGCSALVLICAISMIVIVCIFKHHRSKTNENLKRNAYIQGKDKKEQDGRQKVYEMQDGQPIQQQEPRDTAIGLRSS